MDITSRVRDLAQPLARAEGVDLLDVQYVQEGPQRVLRLVIERPGGPTSVGDCETVSRAVSRALDTLDLIPEAYSLEVSSAGLTRPLRTLDDFERSRGQLVLLTLRQGGPLVGRLVAAAAEGLALDLEDGSRRMIPLADVARARREIEFGPRWTRQ